MKKPLAIGVDDYKKMIDEAYYYVDKTQMIKDLIDKKGEVNLFTRPRRFGKTLTISMLQTFFEEMRGYHGESLDNAKYFVGKKIMQAGKKYTSQMGKSPVISLSLKSAKQPSFEMAYASIIDEIAKEYDRHQYILSNEEMNIADRKRFLSIQECRGSAIDNAKSLVFLSECLEQYHHKKVIILIDEYDVPLENAYFRGFYMEMIDYIRSLFESALKTSASLDFAVITGCLRISKESIFTGLNNLDVNSILDDNYAEHFGFTPQEVEELLSFYHLEDKSEAVRSWYDGYLFGNTEVYNPWSVVNYVKQMLANQTAYPKAYWSNTSSNSIIRELVEAADIQVKQEIEHLIEGGTIEKPIHEVITYEDIHKTQDNLWNFLFFTGYLKAVSSRFEVDTIYLTMAIPNTEVRYIYKNTIHEWFEQSLKNMNLSTMYQAILDGDVEHFGNEVTMQLGETISVFDYAENYYHGFLIGLLKACPGYIVLSNRESGNGRPDIVMKTPSVRGNVIIIEVKIAKQFKDMEKCCDAALAQIEEQNYEAEFVNEGYSSFMKYGICFYRKECMVKK